MVAVFPTDKGIYVVDAAKDDKGGPVDLKSVNPSREAREAAAQAYEWAAKFRAQVSLPSVHPLRTFAKAVYDDIDWVCRVSGNPALRLFRWKGRSGSRREENHALEDRSLQGAIAFSFLLHAIKLVDRYQGWQPRFAVSAILGPDGALQPVGLLSAKYAQVSAWVEENGPATFLYCSDEKPPAEGDPTHNRDIDARKVEHAKQLFEALVEALQAFEGLKGSASKPPKTRASDAPSPDSAAPRSRRSDHTDGGLALPGPASSRSRLSRPGRLVVIAGLLLAALAVAWMLSQTDRPTVESTAQEPSATSSIAPPPPEPPPPEDVRADASPPALTSSALPHVPRTPPPHPRDAGRSKGLEAGPPPASEDPGF